MNQTSETCPIDLDYPAPREPALRIDRIVREGRAIRRRRGLAWTAGLAAFLGAVVGTATVATTVHRSPVIGGPTGTNATTGVIDDLLTRPWATLHPPIDGLPVLVESSVPGWSTYTWLSADGTWCVENYSRDPGDPGYGQCTGFQPGKMWDGHHTPIGWAMPLGQLYRPGRFLAVGLVSAPAATITITYAGHDYTADTTPIPSDGTTAVVAYSIWLDGATYAAHDFTAAVARDADGDIIAQVPPPAGSASAPAGSPPAR